MKIELMYDGKSSLEVVELKVPDHEFEAMIEFDYQERLVNAVEDELVERRTPQEIFDEMNCMEYNSWQTHNRRKVSLQQIDEDDFEMNALDLVADYTQTEQLKKQEDYEATCQKIREILKPDQAEMMISILMDGMSIKDYADKINDIPNLVTQRLIYAKRILRKEIISK